METELGFIDDCCPLGINDDVYSLRPRPQAKTSSPTIHVNLPFSFRASKAPFGLITNRSTFNVTLNALNAVSTYTT